MDDIWRSNLNFESRNRSHDGISTILSYELLRRYKFQTYKFDFKFERNTERNQYKVFSMNSAVAKMGGHF